MKTIGKLFIITFFVCGLVFSRPSKANVELVVKKPQVCKEYSWVKDVYKEDINDNLDRKRSHKRRRKIRKPIKGLR